MKPEYRNRYRPYLGSWSVNNVSYGCRIFSSRREANDCAGVHRVGVETIYRCSGRTIIAFFEPMK